MNTYEYIIETHEGNFLFSTSDYYTALLNFRDIKQPCVLKKINFIDNTEQDIRIK